MLLAHCTEAGGKWIQTALTVALASVALNNFQLHAFIQTGE